MDRYAWLSAVRADVAAIRSLPKEATPPEQRLTADAVIVASAIADRVSAKMGYAFPRLSALADMTGLKERGLRGIVDQLVARGHLHVKVSRGPGASNRYWILRQGGGGADVDDEPEPDENRHGGAGNNRHGGAGIQGGNRHDRAGKYRHGDDTNTGMAVPPNAIINAVESNAAAPPPVGGGGRTAVGKETAARPESSSPTRLFLDPADRVGVAPPPTPDGVTDRTDFAMAPQVADGHAARQRRERDWRRLVGGEPVAIAVDAHVLHEAVERGDFTEADVLAGIERALAEPGFRPRQWRSLVGWVRRSAQDRMAATPRAQAAPAVPGASPQAVPAGYVLCGGAMHSRARVEAAREEFLRSRTWSAEFGMPPDDPLTDLPEDLRVAPRSTNETKGENDIYDARNTEKITV